MDKIKYCSICRHDTGERETYCPNCGTKVSEREAEIDVSVSIEEQTEDGRPHSGNGAVSLEEFFSIARERGILEDGKTIYKDKTQEK